MPSLVWGFVVALPHWHFIVLALVLLPQVWRFFSCRQHNHLCLSLRTSAGAQPSVPAGCVKRNRPPAVGGDPKKDLTGEESDGLRRMRRGEERGWLCRGSMLVLQLASDDRSRSVVGGVRPVAAVCDPGVAGRVRCPAAGGG